MGVLYARVAGAWVPVIGSGPAGNVQSIIGGNSISVNSTDIANPVVSLISPAYAGPWRSTAGGVDINTASYSNTLAGLRKEGMHVDASGYVRFYAKAGDVSGGNQIQFHEVTADHVTSSWIASLFKESFQVGDIVMGRHPTHLMFGVFIRSEVGGSGPDYLVLRDSGGALLLDSTAGANLISLRKGNTVMMDVRTESINVTGMFSCNRTSPNNSWNTAHYLAYPTSNGADQARFAGHSPGVAPQLRVVSSNGSTWGVVNEDSTGWAIIGAAGFQTNSSLVDKREVTTLGDKLTVRSLFPRERIIVNYSPRCDEVPPPDIMSLRPVTFRPRVPMYKVVPTNGESYDKDDPDSWTLEPQDGIFGLEGTRERLGLVAEEVETVIPSAVNHNINGEALGIDYAQITVALLDHVQRLTEEIATLRYRITELENT